MSKVACEARHMKKPHNRCPVVLEPELEEEAALMTPSQRRAFAAMLERWARQLRVSAVILERCAGLRPRPSLKPLPRRRLRWN